MQHLERTEQTVTQTAAIIFARAGRRIRELLRTGGDRRKRGLIDLEKTNGYALPDSRSRLSVARENVMSRPSPHEVTQLLLDWRNGDKEALDKLTPLVYNELRRLANHYLRGERKDHTLQGTALVHEAYIRLIGQGDLEWQNRAHFFGVAARLMRQILVDHARKHRAAKRGSGERDLSLDEAAVFSAERASSLVALDDALESLAQFDERKSRLVELRYFGGLSIEEISEVEETSVATVKRHMRMAEAWLHKEMSKG
ncbi:MAG TPA: sigma-70 family RNA polymerase sigma factor [Blastocatellia bacterium]|nr:sigma-70 family RNA polymerase sigma factor [Blastocatellia bacterium]